MSGKTFLVLIFVVMFGVSGLSGCDGDSTTSPSPQLKEVLYNSGAQIAGFQFRVTGIDVTNARDGIAGSAGFTISTGNNVVIGFSLTGTTIPGGSGVLVILDVAGSGHACLADLIVSDSLGNALAASVENCLTIRVHA